MSDLVKEKPIMEEVQKRYNNFIKDRLMMNEYDKREAYLYGNQIMLEEERRLGIEKGEKMKAISIARNLKKSGIDIRVISENTGISIEEIKKLWAYSKFICYIFLANNFFMNIDKEIKNLWVPDIRKNSRYYLRTSFL